MSYDVRERSLADGQPIRLYEFKRGVLRWLYNSSDRDITHNSQIFRTVRGGMVDDGIRQSGEAEVDTLVITAPGLLEVAQFYRGVPPSAEIDLVVWDMHAGETQVLVSWMGTIKGVKWPQLDRCDIAARTFEASLDDMGLAETWTRSCTHTIYSLACGVDRNGFKVEVAIQSMTGLSLSSGPLASFANGWFAGGFIEWPIGSGEFERRAIETHVGSVLQLLGGTAGLVNGQTVFAFPGCDGLIPTCKDKFANHLQYGGVPRLAGDSPFDGNPRY